ncbi:MAG: SprT-like domain-containing protein, partial [Muribaculaceae bacterium]|nr:SprT-like domain-containing protein [Muribaculaceae bacterium]
MRADLKFVTDRFNTFNASVFGGQLPTPQFAIVTARTFAGRFTYRIKRGPLGTRHAYDPCLRISRCFDMPQNEIEDIILHEMIHYYIFHKRITDNAPHGRQFRHIMQKINALHGRNITISARIDRSTGSTDTRVRQHLIC